MMEMDQFGKIIATDIQGANDCEDHYPRMANICPFSGESLSETEISKNLFPTPQNEDEKIGRYEACFGGHVLEGVYREKGTSGGVSKWLGAELLSLRLIDYFIQVAPTDEHSTLFSYKVFSSSDSLLTGSKACYYPVTLNEVYDFIRNNPGAYAITAIPCFAKSIRLMQLEDKIIKHRVHFVVGIICGGLKTANYAKFISMQYPVEPAKMVRIDFRKKTVGASTRVQATQISYLDQNAEIKEDSRPNTLLKGLDYGMGLFKPKPCDYCDDIVAETADISVGDAWLPEFEKDQKGDSVVIVRNKMLVSVVEAAMANHRVSFKRLTSSDIVTSQAAGFRQRREGLAVRIMNAKSEGMWFPKKRNLGNVSRNVSKRRQHIYLLREKIAAESHKIFVLALESNSIQLFLDWLEPQQEKYRKLNRPGLLQRVLKRITKSIFREG
tara:strand:- start:1345 stop:2661 length:1317 start_codon:yes stop_codon:yes gene_type:complete